MAHRLWTTGAILIVVLGALPRFAAIDVAKLNIGTHPDEEDVAVMLRDMAKEVENSSSFAERYGRSDRIVKADSLQSVRRSFSKCLP